MPAAGKKAKDSAAEKLVQLCEEIAYDRKAENIVRIDLKAYSAVSDYFILCTATSAPHVGAVADRIRREVLEKIKVKPLRIDGSPESHWMIVDYGSVMVHIMTEDMRSEYQLENLWAEAPVQNAVRRIENRLRKKAQDAKKTAAAADKDAKPVRRAPAKKTAAKKTVRRTVKKSTEASE